MTTEFRVSYIYEIDIAIDIRCADRYCAGMLTLPTIPKARVKVSPKFQIVIPKAIREELKIEPGQELFMYVYEGKLYIDLLGPVTELRGIAKGMKWKQDYRDRNDRI
jgi:AbrB family looped-hinge helix DNA binding protein